MSFLDKIKEAAFEEDAAPVSNPAKVQRSAAPPIFVATPKVDNFVSGNSMMPATDENVVLLQNAIGVKNGIIAKFFDTAASLAEYIPDETKRWKAAAATLAKQGITAADLTGELQETLKRLDMKVAEFENSKTQKMSDEVDGKMKQAAAITSQLITLGQQRDDLEAQATTAKARIQAGADRFNVAVTVVREYYLSIQRKTGETK